MGLISAFLQSLFQRGTIAEIGRAGVDVAEVFRPNATRQMELGHDAFSAAQAAHMAEFRYARRGGWDAFVNGLNRLPRPMLALGALGLFAFAMADPDSFTVRMQGLGYIPEPLWWLLGAVVAFYFGARETHHLRDHRRVGGPMRAPGPSADLPIQRPQTSTNPALNAWLNRDEATADTPN